MLIFGGIRSSGSPEKIRPLDDVIVAVTDLTDAGRKQPIPSPQNPVYFIGINAGFLRYNGIAMGGDPPPEEKQMLRVITQVLANQGFRPADTDHPATQVIVCSWGVIGTQGRNLLEPGPGIQFLGGERFGLVGEDVCGDLLRRGFHSGAADTVYEMSQSNLYGVLFRAYDLHAAEAGEQLQLWETRLACSSPGNSLTQALPRLVVSGQHAIGRETIEPIVQNAARSREAWVEIGESTVVEYLDCAPASTAKESGPDSSRPAVPSPEPTAK